MENKENESIANTEQVQEEKENSKILELEQQIKDLTSQLNLIKQDNSTLFKAINENLEKVVSNTSKEVPTETKPKRF